ncbi:MAG: permease [Syntrophobacteraceae bacterium]|jgi:uncharacterized membrane protein YraQ (UPF0718 family)
MKTIHGESCACDGNCNTGEHVPLETTASSSNMMMTVKYILPGVPIMAAWWFLYKGLEPFAGWLAGHFVQFLSKYNLTAGSIEHLRSSIEFFFYDTPKVLMLLVLVVFGVGIIRSFFTPERTRKILAGKRESAGNVLAAMLGIVTPFCSCSAVPLFIGFLTASVPLGVTFSFLISAPMVNEIALVLLYGLFGWKIAAIYMSTGLIIAMLAGWTIGLLKMERHLEDWVYKIQVGESGVYDEERKSIADRIHFGLEAVRDIVGKVWIYVILGIAVGAGIHGYVPEGYLASIMGKGAWWSVPVAVLIGIPIYSNAAGIIPVVSALMEKGAAMGTVLAFMMSVVAISFPETVILRKVLKPRLILVFTGVVAAGIIIVGYLFNALI